MHTRRRPSGPGGRSDSGGPRATGASAGAPAGPGGATASHPSAGLSPRRRHSTDTTPQPSAAPGWVCPGVAGQPAKPLRSPRRPKHGRGRGPPTPSGGSAAPHSHSPPSPRPPGRPRRRRASASAAPVAVGSPKAAPQASRRGRSVACRWSMLWVQRGHDPARRGPGDSPRPRTRPLDHARGDPLCHDRDAPPRPTAGLF